MEEVCLDKPWLWSRMVYQNTLECSSWKPSTTYHSKNILLQRSFKGINFILQF